LYCRLPWCCGPRTAVLQYGVAIKWSTQSLTCGRLIGLGTGAALCLTATLATVSSRYISRKHSKCPLGVCGLIFRKAASGDHFPYALWSRSGNSRALQTSAAIRSIAWSGAPKDGPPHQCRTERRGCTLERNVHEGDRLRVRPPVKSPVDGNC